MTVAPDHRTDTLAFVAYWLLASPFILSSWSPEEQAANNHLVFYAYMVVSYTAAAWLIVNVVFPNFLTRRRYVLAMGAVLGVLLVVATGTYLIDVAVYDNQPDWWTATLNYNLGNDAQNVLTLVAILAGKKFIAERQRATELESERRASELARLRAQVDPHFLFNSLNILDILIEDDPAQARQFVHRLSNLYRYLIRHRDEDLVPAADELAYARDYQYLVEQRFGDAFHFREILDSAQLEHRYMPPGSLQTVLENVYKHNLATERNPVTITLEAREEALYITNDFSPKPGNLATHERSGSGTANLLRRYTLLTDDEVYARREEKQWVVRLPLLAASPARTYSSSTPLRQSLEQSSTPPPPR